MNDQILAETPWYVWLVLGAAGMYVAYNMMSDREEDESDEWEEV